jgi:hypothetical protein
MLCSILTGVRMRAFLEIFYPADQEGGPCKRLFRLFRQKHRPFTKP